VTTRRILILLPVLAALGAGGVWYAQQKGGGDPQVAKAATPTASRAIPVVTKLVEVRAVPDRIGTIGSVQPIAAIAIKARRHRG
jgi:membrane fusion protein, multidrug efflux system